MDEQEKIAKFKKAHEDGDDNKLHQSLGGKYIGDVVYGANDGIISTFAVVSAIAGANLQVFIVLIVGFANLLADGFSMAAGNYLGTKSEKSYIDSQRKTEEWEVDNIPEMEKKEIREIYRKKGFTGTLLDKVVNVITKNKKRWVDTMMLEELHLPPHEDISPFKKGLATFLSFVVFGFMPLLPYAFGIEPLFKISVIITFVTLFVIGAGRSLITGANWFKSGIEMLLIGMLAAFVAYSVGYLLSGIAQTF